MKMLWLGTLAIVGAALGIGAAQAQEADASTILEAWMASPHGNAEAEAFKHWDEEGEIPGGCAYCHSGTGFLDHIGADGSAAGSVESMIETGSLVDCDTCHAPEAQQLAAVTFPSGIEITGIEKGGMCMVCHQGRESTPSVNEALAGMDDDAVNADLGFVNVHYRAAAATLLGTEVKGGYEYEGQSYMGRFAHVPPFSACTDCHDPHALTVDTAPCAGCHMTEELDAIRAGATDFDGDGDVAEGIAMELERLHGLLLAAIQSYAAEVADAPIVYADAYPYFFADTNADGVAGDDEAAFPNRYLSWTPRLLRAAYNYQFVAKDPGAFAHNPHYALQLMYDSIADLGSQAAVDMAGIARP